MIRNGTHCIYRLSELAPHWRNSETNDPRLLDFLRCMWLLTSHAQRPELTPHQRIAALAMVEISVLDDRNDYVAMEKAKLRDQRIERELKDNERLPGIVEYHINGRLDIFERKSRARGRVAREAERAPEPIVPNDGWTTGKPK